MYKKRDNKIVLRQIDKKQMQQTDTKVIQEQSGQGGKGDPQGIMQEI